MTREEELTLLNEYAWHHEDCEQVIFKYNDKDVTELDWNVPCTCGYLELVEKLGID